MKLYENVTFFADTPENLENILEEIKSLTSSQGLLVEMDESSYQTAAQPLHQIRMISLILMIMAGGICAIILYLLINLWTEGRRKELKILRSLGFTKKGILGQLILEGVILAFVAVLVGTAVSIPIREQIFTVVENWTEPEEGIAEFEEVVTEGNQQVCSGGAISFGKSTGYAGGIPDSLDSWFPGGGADRSKDGIGTSVG